MAITWFGRVASLAAANDTLPGRVRVNAINLVAGATGGATTVNVGGTSGIKIIDSTIAANTSANFAFSEPQELDDIWLKTVGTNVTLVVFTC